MNKLLADSGSTKTQWVLLVNGRAEASVRTPGMNPYFISDYRAAAIVMEDLIPNLPEIHIDEIHFYGAGCSTDNNTGIITSALRESVKDADIKVYHDILGAARALCGNTEGIACILGTGCNSCYYDGTSVYSPVPSLGYLFGDEGAGSYIGKKLLESYLKKSMPERLAAEFEKEFNLTLEEILKSLYNKPSPNRYLASFSHFIAPRVENPFLYDLVQNAFTDFFQEHVTKYQNFKDVPVNFAGSVAWFYRDILLSVATGFGATVNKVLESPMKGLIEYHG